MFRTPFPQSHAGGYTPKGLTASNPALSRIKPTLIPTSYMATYYSI
jgi:hypothetical protein